jgi:HD-GYP domain-containing protein (c-di-GMP phosphodiesterase class II)
MKMRRAPIAQDPFPSSFVDRCETLDLTCWRLDLNGMPTQDPSAPGVLGMWLSSRSVRMLVTDAATQWGSSSTLEPTEIHPGLWLFPFEEVHRERRTGYFVVIGFSEQILGSGLIDAGCKGNQLQTNALLHVLNERISLHKNNASQVMQTLHWMLEDIRSLKKNEEAIEQFSEQLGESYEVVTTLQNLGASMGGFRESDEIVEEGIEEIASTLEYSWAACAFNENSKTMSILSSSVFQAGELELSDADFNVIIDHIKSSEPIGYADFTEIYAVPLKFDQLRPQILAHPMLRDGEQVGVLIAGGKLGDDPQVSSHETKLMESISGMLGSALENAELYHQAQLTFLGTIKALSGAIDAKDQYTQGHSERVAMLSYMLAKEVGFSEEDAERIRISGLVHDLGKIGVPENVLCKPARLTDEEFDLIKQHPSIGHEIIKDIPDLQDLLPGVLYHHERWDGRGYPEGLSGGDIPRMARIMALADTFDAMSSNRAYRQGMDRDKVFAEFRKCAGSQFDPELVEPFLALDFRIYDDMVSRHKSQAPASDDHDRKAA